MPTIETKFGVGDRVTAAGKLAVVEGILLNRSGLAYYVTGRVEQVDAALVEPPPPEAEVWPKGIVGRGKLRYADGGLIFALTAEEVERFAKAERLVWLVACPRELDHAELAERGNLATYFRKFHGPNGEVYLEPRGEPCASSGTT